MSLKFSIDRAAEIVGSQNKLAEQLGLKGPNLSEMRSGKRTCPISVRAQIAHIAGHDTTRAILEGLASKLDPNDEWEGKALATLQAVIDAFPEQGEADSQKAKNPASANTDGVVWRRRKVPALHLAALEIARRLRNAIHGTLHDRLRDAVPHRQLPVRHAASAVFSHQLRFGV